MSSGGGGGGRSAPNFGETFEAFRDPFKNLENAGQRITQGIGAMASGNFNNAGTTLLETQAFLTSAGLSGAAGFKAGETPAERATREAMEAAREAERVTEAQLTQDKRRRANALVESSAAARLTTPGAAQTLLTSGYGGSLLTQRRS